MNCKHCGKTVFVKETCTCGETAPDKNRGGVIANNIVCIVLLVGAVLALIVSVSLRYIVNNDLLVKTVGDADLTQIEMKDDSGETLQLDEWLYNKYIDDDRITVKNVDNVLNHPFIKNFLTDKIHGIQDFLMNEGEPVTITSNDIIELIDKNSDLLYNEAGLNFLEPDKDDLRKNLSGLDDLAAFSDDHMSGWFSSSLVQTPFSLAYVIFLTVLLGIILAQWLLVYRFNGRRMLKALTGYGIAVIVPSALLFVPSLAFVIATWKSQAGEALRICKLGAPFMVSSGILLVVGVIMLVASVVVTKMSADKTAVPEGAADALPDNAVTKDNAEDTAESADADAEGFAPKSGFAEPVTKSPEAEEEKTDSSAWTVKDEPSIWAKPAEEKRPEAKPADEEKPKSEDRPKKEFVFCTKCGNKNRAGSAFCSKCGNKLRK